MTQYKKIVVLVTERRNGATYRTKEIGQVWVDDSDVGDTAKEAAIAKANGGDFLCSVSLGTPYNEFAREV